MFFNQSYVLESDFSNIANIYDDFGATFYLTTHKNFII